MNYLHNDLIRLLSDLEKQETTARRRYKEACDERDTREEATPLDAARIEYNRGEMTAYGTVASRVKAILNADASAMEADAERIRRETR